MSLKRKPSRKPTTLGFIQFLLLRPIIAPDPRKVEAVNPAVTLLRAEARLVAGGWTPKQAKFETRHPERRRR